MVDLPYGPHQRSAAAGCLEWTIDVVARAESRRSLSADFELPAMLAECAGKGSPLVDPKTEPQKKPGFARPVSMREVQQVPEDLLLLYDCQLCVREFHANEAWSVAIERVYPPPGPSASPSPVRGAK